MNDSTELLVLVVGTAMIGLILGCSLIAASVIQHRRYLRARRSFAARLITAQDEERAAIARELHDDIVQRLISIAADVRTADEGRRGPAAVRLDRLADDLRSLARGMHPSVVDHVPLGEALAELASSIEEREGVLVEFHDHSGPEQLPLATRLSLYRIAQEALGNAARHAGVDHVRLGLRHEEGNLVLEISDRGRGFDQAGTHGGPGIGLSSMRERLEGLGGSITIASAPGRGTRITATVPRPRGTA